mgnify:CR=1 FL=1
MCLCLNETDSNLKCLLNIEMKDWSEGSKRVFWFSHYELGFRDEPTEEDLEQIGHFEYVEDVVLGEDLEIIVTVNEQHLQQLSNSQLRNWVEESDLKQLGRHESYGWI